MADEGWVEPEYSQDILIAVGRLALSFAGLDVGLAMALSHLSEDDFPEVCSQPLSTKLTNVKRKGRSRKQLKLIPIKRIGELAKIRNDLMHGFVFISVYPSVGDLNLWNPARGRSTNGVTPLSLDKVSEELEAIAKNLPLKGNPKTKISN